MIEVEQKNSTPFLQITAEHFTHHYDVIKINLLACYLNFMYAYANSVNYTVNRKPKLEVGVRAKGQAAVLPKPNLNLSNKNFTG